MKKDEQLDDLFKTGFEPDFSEEIPTNFLTDINARLDKLEKKKKRSVAIWWVPGIFSLFGMILFAYSLSTKEHVSPNSAKLKISQSQPNSNPVKKVETPAEKGFIAKKIDLQTGNLMSKKGLPSEKESDVKSIIQNEKFTTQTTNLIFQKNSTNNKNQRDNNLNTESTDLKWEESNEDQKSLKIDGNNELVKPSVGHIENTSDSANIEITLLNKNTDSSVQFVIKNDFANNCSTNENKLSENKNVNNRQLKLKYRLGFYSGVSGIFHKILSPDLSNTVNVSSNSAFQYREKRQLEESMITSWDLGMRFGIQSNKWIFSTGIDYFVWGERTDYSNVSYNAQFKNIYRFVNIPLQIGYEFQKGSYGIQPTLGLSTGFLIKEVQGYYLNIDNSFSSYQVNINKFTGTFHAGFEVTYFSQSGVKVSFSPVFRQALGTIVKSEIVKNRYSSLGLQMGIGYTW